MTTVAQATEKILVESATAVVAQVAKSNTGDLKTIESSVVKEAVSATDEPVPNLLDKVQDGLKDVANEVVKGAESTVQAVEQHPELIAEGALAVAVGAASLVQPELVTGEIAIVGKMAADSAKKTVTTIAQDEGSKVVKAISKDIADDAKKEDAKGAAAKAERDKDDGKESRNAAVKVASDEKSAAADAAKDGTKVGEKGKEVVTEAINSKVVPVEPKNDAPNNAVSTPPDSKIASKDKTIAIEVAQEPSKVTNDAGATSDSKPETPTAVPVSLKITLGADGEVKAVTKEEKVKDVDPVPSTELVALKTSSVETTTKTGVASTEATKGDPETVHTEPPSISQLETVSLKGSEKNQEVPQTNANTSSIAPPAVVSAIATVTSKTKTNTASKTTTDDSDSATQGKMVTVSQESLDLLHRKLDAMHEAIQQITKILTSSTPLPAPAASGSKPNETIEDVISETLAAAVKPLTELVPEVMHQNDDTTHPPLEDPLAPKSPPKRPIPGQRSSFIGAMGKVFWPFGSSEKVAAVTVAEVGEERAEVTA